VGLVEVEEEFCELEKSRQQITSTTMHRVPI